MSSNIHQIFIANPITTNASTDLMYFGQSPYGATNDAAMTYANFSAQFALAALTSAHFYVGNASNIATNVAMSGDAALANTGAVTVSKIGGVSISLAGSFTTSGAFAVTQTYTGATNVTFPTSGTLATTSQLPTPAALTEVNDTNVTLTLGGTPATALLQATSITAGWTGTLSGTRGGTGVNNGASTITIGGNLTLSGAFTTTFTVTANTSVTLPTSGTLATTSQFVIWNDVSGTTQAASGNNGYIISNAAQTTVTIPATIAEGQVIAIAGKGAAGWILQANTGQTIHYGSSATSSAGSLTSTNQWDAVQIVCVTANTTFTVIGSQGNLTVA